MQKRLTKAQQEGDDDTVKTTLAQMDKISNFALRESNAKLNTEGKLPLAQAQAEHVSHWRDELRMKLNAQMQRLDKATQARVNAAGVSAGAGGRIRKNLLS